jgi:choline kinase
VVNNLRAQGIERLVVVIGYKGDRIREFLSHYADSLWIDYVYNSDYRTTNNIYSLWLARQQIRESFLLVESDLVFDALMLADMLHPDKIAISRILPWMNGTTVSLDQRGRVTRFHIDRHPTAEELTHKTVNMYSFSCPSWQRVTRRLEHYISTGRVSAYYEAVFAEMIADGELSFEAVFMDHQRWYEIDTLEDLREAERLFSRIDGRRTTGAVGP